ncbi:MAG: hypothetical protein JW901_12415 [Dehalococcoidia bacterium]|nr:hypothetical protein [Dehalococcoidia bacterium]
MTTVGCQSSEGNIQASLDKEFSLSIGQIAEIKSEHITLQFEGIQEDSRCPKGATCFWAGRVISVLLINDNGLISRIVLTEPGTTNQPDINTYRQYEFTLLVQPYPELGKQLSKEEYRLFLTVKKIPAGID